MQVFEFHFNPPLQKRHSEKNKNAAANDLLFDSFCYEPENIYERKAGSLYMAGLLKNALPHNANFLENLAKTIKEKYYTNISSPEKSLRQSLRKANEYLEAISRKGDVSWLGNINFSTLSAAALQKGYEFNFTKVGEIKILLLRNGHLIDIDQKLKFEGIEPYPLKIFGNIISGKLVENDVILVFTEKVFEYFEKENIISGICNISAGQFDIKQLKEILNNNRENLLKLSGVFLTILFNKENSLKEKEKFLSREKTKTLALVNFNFLSSMRLPDISTNSLRGILRLKMPLPDFLKTNPIDRFFPAFFAFLETKDKRFNLISRFSAKNLFLILIFLILLGLGFFIFDKQEKQKLAQYQDQINQIENNVQKAENYLITAQYNPRSRKQASLLLKQSLEEISAFIKISPALSKNMGSEIKSLEEKISQKLYEINKLKILKDPNIIFEFDSRGFVPQKMLFSNNKIYFFSPFAENIFELNSENKGNALNLNKKIHLAANARDSAVFISKSGKISSLKDGKFSDASMLKPPYPEFILSDLASYYSNFYVLDNKNKNLIKYSYIDNMNWSDPEVWLKNDSITEIKSIAVDGSLWALTTEDSIQRYYAQKLQQNIKLDIFPEPKNFSKIFTSNLLPYLYLLEPQQQRIVILDKSGQIENQIQSQKFDNLLDFAVTDDGKTIFILNGLSVFKIDL